MSRRARLAMPNVALHIIQRGHNRSACFYADADYELYLAQLTELSSRFGCLVHAYALMANHVHLLITPRGHDSAALLMKHLGQRYVQYINRTYERSGTLWEGRFRSCMAQGARYVLTCYRYIELNPVRACVVWHPREYRWSSYRANAEGMSTRALAPHADYLALGPHEDARHQAYRCLFDAALDPQLVREIRSATNGNFALGSGPFMGEMAAALGCRVTPGKPGRPAKAH